MVEKSISGDSSEHIEIEILGEIEGLLASKHESLPIFLHKILNKTSELIGADLLKKYSMAQSSEEKYFYLCKFYYI